jgi:uncharacterized spore protein YtfJ
MSSMQQDFVAAAKEQQAKSLEQLDRLLQASRPDAVFGKPITVGDSQILTASETFATVGFGFGVGGGEALEGAPEPREQRENEDEAESGGVGGGGGGGGGGLSLGRPVAVVRVDPLGVTVEPIVDVTKIALAAFTALGSMFLMFARMARKAQ